MASYVTPKYGTQFIMYIGLESVATAGTFQSNPTLASGDFKVSVDGGALANLTTLPTVTPTGGKGVKITLSASEMTGDNITIFCSDASGGEWKDLIINLQTTARQIDDLAPSTATDTIAAYIDTEVAAIKAKTDNLPASPAAVGSAMTLASGAITSSVIATDAITSNGLAASAVAEIQSGLATSVALAALDALVQAIKAKTDNLPSDPADESSIQAALTAIAAYIDTEVAAIKAKTDNLPATPASTSDIPSANTIADTVLGRSVSNAEGAAGLHSLTELILAILESSTATGSWVIKKTNGSTIFNTRTLVTDGSALPIIGVS